VNYFQKHWRGELSLALSFWINLVLCNLLIYLLSSLPAFTTIDIHPKTGALVYLGMVLAWSLLLFPWQVIGVWRAAIHHVEKSGRMLLARCTQVLVILLLLQTLVSLYNSMPAYKELYKMVFAEDPIANYTIAPVKDDTLLHITGNFGFGLADAVADLLEKNPGMTGVIIDSTGGRLFEGRELAKLILRNNLDTYTLRGCYSACSTAFVAGRKRYLVLGANLGFHAYGVSSANLRSMVDIQHEQEKDLRIYRQQGVSQEFLDRLFSAEHDSMWFPEIDELIEANIVHEVVRGQDVLPNIYQISADRIDQALLRVPVFQVIKEKFPATYEEIQAEFQSQASIGSSAETIQLALSVYIERIALQERSKTSDDSLIQYVMALIEVLSQLERENPALCHKLLYPDTFGGTKLIEYLDSSQVAWMVSILSQVIINSQGQEALVIDREAAAAKADIINLMQPPTGLQDEEDYRQACSNAIINYKSILKLDKASAVNDLRYLFSE
jgi:hypothetical protein